MSGDERRDWRKTLSSRDVQQRSSDVEQQSRDVEKAARDTLADAAERAGRNHTTGTSLPVVAEIADGGEDVATTVNSSGNDNEGAEVASGFTRNLLFRQMAAAVVAFVVVALLAPWSLMIESRHLVGLWRTSVIVGLIGLLGVVLLSLPSLSRSRRLFRALALEPEPMRPSDIDVLASLPFWATIRFVFMGALCSALMAVPGVRPVDLDSARAISLSLLTFTTILAMAVVLHVAIRNIANRAIELAPLDPVTEWLEEQAMRLTPRKRVVRKVLLAVVVPVVLVGVGAVLVSHAHQRALVESSRQETAALLTLTALDPAAARLGDAGRDDAMAAAGAHGFLIKFERGATAPPGGSALPQRNRYDQLQLPTTVEDGFATTRYEAELSSSIITTSLWLALIAGLLAALLGWLFGRVLAHDLVLATQQVSSLGTESVLRGTARVAGPARFAVVAELGGSVEALAERFRTFAAAQERALDAKASAQRMKQLLFASVSHDLKSPLNAILGFAELLRDEPLSASQLESLDMVSGRGRELLALIETILDAARVQAGQLRLSPQLISTEAAVNEALEKAFDLHGERIEVFIELPPGLPPLHVDPAHAVRAVAVLIAHAMDSASTEHHRSIRVRGSLPAGDRGGARAVRLHIEHVARGHRPSFLEAQLSGRMRPDTGRGMALRLSLARAIIDLHGGRVDVGRGPHGAAVVTCWLPIGTPRSEFD